MKRVISLLLSIAMVFSLLPAQALAANEQTQEQPTAVTEETVLPSEETSETVAPASEETEEPETEPETSEPEAVEETTEETVVSIQNEAAAAVSASEMTQAEFEALLANAPDDGSVSVLKDVTLEENMTIDYNGYIFVTGGTITIPEGKKLTLGSNAYLSIQNNGALNVQGELEVLNRYGALEVYGGAMTVGANAAVNFFHGGMIMYSLDLPGTITGVDPQQVYGIGSVEDAAALKTVAEQGAAYGQLSINIRQGITLDRDIVIPTNASVGLFCMQGEQPFALTVPQGYTLTNHGRIMINENCTLLVNGTFKNTGYVNVLGSYINNGTEENHGTLNKPIKDLAGLKDALASADQDRPVQLNFDLTLSDGEELVIPESVQLNVNGKLTVLSGAKVTISQYGSIGAGSEETVIDFQSGSSLVNNGYLMIQFGTVTVAQGVLSGTGVFDLFPEATLTGVANRDIWYHDAFSDTATLNAAMENFTTAGYRGANVNFADDVNTVTLTGTTVIPEGVNIAFGWGGDSLILASGAHVTNNGSIDIYDDGSITVEEGATLINNSSISGTVYGTVEGNQPNSGGGGGYEPEGTEIINLEDLKAALSDDVTEDLYIIGDLVLDADLVINTQDWVKIVGSLTVPSGTTLDIRSNFDVSGGNLTVKAGGTLQVSDYGWIQIISGRLIAEAGAAVVIENGALWMYVDYGAVVEGVDKELIHVMTFPDNADELAAALELANDYGSVEITPNCGFVLSQNLTIPENACLNVHAFEDGLTITVPSGVKLTNNGAVYINQGTTLLVEAGGTLDNNGYIGYAADPGSYINNGNEVNNGTIDLEGGSSGEPQEPEKLENCGEKLRWEFDAATGTLTVSGKGAMYDLDYSTQLAPWNDYRHQITNVVINEGVTTVGDHMFDCYTAITSVSLPDTLKAINEQAFFGCSGLTEITIPAGVTQIGKYAFGTCMNLKYIICEGSAPSIGSNAFSAVVATLRYPRGDASWADAAVSGYGGVITWESYQVTPDNACGDALVWEFDEDTGTLTISGTGAMYDYTHESCPWYNDDLYLSITSLVIEEGVTEIGGSAFAMFGMLKEITVPVTLTAIGQNAFQDVTAHVYYPFGSDAWDTELMQQYGGELLWVAIGETEDEISLQSFLNGVEAAVGVGYNLTKRVVIDKYVQQLPAAVLVQEGGSIVITETGVLAPESPVVLFSGGEVIVRSGGTLNINPEIFGPGSQLHMNGGIVTVEEGGQFFGEPLWNGSIQSGAAPRTLEELKSFDGDKRYVEVTDSITVTESMELTVGGLFVGIYGELIIPDGVTLDLYGHLPVEKGNVVVQAGGTLNVHSEGCWISNGGSVTVEEGGTLKVDGELAVQAGGTLNNSGSTSSRYNFILENNGVLNGAWPGSDGYVSPMWFDSQMAYALENGEDVTLGGGKLVLSDGMELTLQAGKSLSLIEGAELVVPTGATVTLNCTLMVNDGTLTVEQGGKLISNVNITSNFTGVTRINGTLENYGSFWVNNGSRSEVNGTMTSYGPMHIGFAGMGELQVNGTLVTFAYLNVTPTGTVGVAENAVLTVDRNEEYCGFIQCDGATHVNGTLNINALGTVGNGSKVESNLEILAGGVLNIGQTDIQIFEGANISAYGTINCDGGIINQGALWVDGTTIINGGLVNTGAVHVNYMKEYSQGNGTLNIKGVMENYGYLNLTPGGTLNVYGKLNDTYRIETEEAPGAAGFVELKGKANIYGVWDTYNDMILSSEGDTAVVQVYEDGSLTVCGTLGVETGAKLINNGDVFYLTGYYVNGGSVTGREPENRGVDKFLQDLDAAKTSGENLVVNSAVILEEDLTIEIPGELSFTGNGRLVVPAGVTLTLNSVVYINGAKLSVEPGGKLINNEALTIHAEPFGDGIAVIDGEFINNGTYWVNTKSKTIINGKAFNNGMFHVGFGEGGELEINGSLTTYGYLNVIATGSIVVNGTLTMTHNENQSGFLQAAGPVVVKGTLNSYALCVIGGEEKKGFVDVRPGGVMNVADSALEITADGWLSCFGKLNCSGEIANHGALWVDGTADFDGKLINYGAVHVAFNQADCDTLGVLNINGTMDDYGYLNVVPGGTLNIAEGAKAEIKKDVDFCGFLQGDGTVKVGGTLTIEGLCSVGNDGEIPSVMEILPNGTVNVGETEVKVFAGATVKNDGILNINGGLVNYGTLQVEKVQNVVGGLINYGTLAVNENGVLNVTESGTLNVGSDDASVGHAVVYGTLNNNGVTFIGGGADLVAEESADFVNRGTVEILEGNGRLLVFSEDLYGDVLRNSTSTYANNQREILAAIRGGYQQIDLIPADDQSIAITGELVIPNGVTLRVTQDAVVNVQENAALIVEDGLIIDNAVVNVYGALVNADNETQWVGITGLRCEAGELNVYGEYSCPQYEWLVVNTDTAVVTGIEPERMVQFARVYDEASLRSYLANDDGYAYQQLELCESIVLEEDLWVQDYTQLYIRKDALLSVPAGTELMNHGYILVAGELSVVSGGSFLNYGSLDVEEGGIYATSKPLATEITIVTGDGTVAPEVITINRGDFLVVDSLIQPAEAEDQKVLWELEQDDLYARWNSTDELTRIEAVNEGEAVLRVSTTDGGTAYDELVVRIVDCSVEITADSEIVTGGKSVKLTASVEAEEYADSDIEWYINEEDKRFVTLKPKGNTVTVTAADVSELQTVTVYAKAVDTPAAPAEFELTIQPKVRSLTIYEYWMDGNEYYEYPLGEYGAAYILSDWQQENGFYLNLKTVAEPEGADCAVSWKSSNTKVADYDEETDRFVFTGKPGNVTFTATAADDSGVKASVTFGTMLPVTVEPVGDTIFDLVNGDSVSLKLRNADTGKNISSGSIEWYFGYYDENGWVSTYEDSDYATISSSGKLTTKNVTEEKTIHITGEAYNGVWYIGDVTYTITIHPSVSHVELWDGDAVVNGQTLLYDWNDLESKTLTAKLLPADALEVPVNWTISDKKEAYAEYEIQGNTVVIKNAKEKAGTVTFTAKADDGSKKTATVKVQFGSFAKTVEIRNTETQLRAGDKALTLKAEITDPEVVSKPGIVWSLKNSDDKAYVNLTSGGKLTAKTVYGEHDVTIVATSKDGKASDDFTIKILPEKDDILILTDENGDNVTKSTVLVDLNKEDTAVTLTAEDFSGGETGVITWSPAKNSKTAEVAIDGNAITVKMQKAGSVTVTAKTADKRSATVTIKAVKLAQDVEISEKKTNAKENLTLASGKSLNLQASAINAASSKVVWSVAEGGELYAKVSSSGKVTATKDLTASYPVTIIAEAADGSGAKGSIDILVMPQAQSVQTFLHAEGTYGSFDALTTGTSRIWAVEQGEVVTFSAEVYPFYREDSDRNASQKVQWKSSNEKILKVDEFGNVTFGDKTGTVTITATADDNSGKKATFKLQVIKPMLELQVNDGHVAGGKTLKLADLVEYMTPDATSKKLYWEVAGGDGAAFVSSISSSGQLKTKKVTEEKTVTIEVKDEYGFQRVFFDVTIHPLTTGVIIWDHSNEVAEEITGGLINLPLGQELCLSSDCLPAGSWDCCTWKVSSVKTAGFVSEDGELVNTCTADVVALQGVKNGKVTVTATAADGSGKKATLTVQIVDALPE